MKKIILLVVIFCAICLARVANAQVSNEAIAKFEITVPSVYNFNTQIDVFKLKAKSDKKIYDFKQDFTSERFSKTTDRVIQGKTYIVEFFPVKNGTTFESALSFLKSHKALLVSMQGLMLLYDLAIEKLPKDKSIASLDKQDNLFVDASGSYMFPFLQTNGGEYYFGINCLAYDFIGENWYLLCLSEKK